MPSTSTPPRIVRCPATPGDIVGCGTEFPFESAETDSWADCPNNTQPHAD